MEKITDSIKELLKQEGIDEVGFSAITPPAAYDGLTNAISLVLPLSDAVIDSVANGPNHTYFHHYRTVNTYLDRVSLRVGLLLSARGFRYVSIPASQSIEGYQGLFSHKEAAVRAGLGTIGRSALFLSNAYGPRVRLATILTDADVSDGFLPPSAENPCEHCRACVNACPALAISGKTFQEGGTSILDRAACSNHMKSAYQKIGRGVVCGICVSVCPAGKKKNENKD